METIRKSIRASWPWEASWLLVALLGTGACGRWNYEVAEQTQSQDDGGATADAAILDTSAWSFRKRITVSTSMTAATLNDFPLVIQATDPELAAGARTDGADLVFTASDGSTALSFELQTWEEGQLLAWVRLPELSSTADTVLYLYYGNDAMTTSVSDGSATWLGYEGVWHLEQDPVSSQQLDSSSRGLSGTTRDEGGDAPFSTVGIVGNAVTLDGVNDWFDLGTSSPAENLSFTMSAWVFNQGADTDYVLDFSNPVATPSKISLVIRDGQARSIVRDQSAEEAEVVGTVDLRNAWHHIAATADGTTLRVLVDGSEIGSVSLSAIGAISTSQVSIGRHETIPLCCWFAGRLDEIRYQPRPRSVEWIAAERTSQLLSEVYITVGAEEAVP